MRIAALLLIAIFTGCAARAADRGPAVNLPQLVRAHPLYGVLAQYDRQIAALRATLHEPEFRQKTRALANAEQATALTLDKAAMRARDIAALPAPNTSTFNASAASAAPSENRVRSDMQQTYAAQSSELRSAAQGDMNRYRAQLLAQQQAAFASYVRAVHARVQQAYVSREQELYEKESTLLLDLAKADAQQRLTIRAKLQTLALDGARRRALQAQLGAIQSREDAIAARQRARDRAILAAFLPPLQARADADVARMRSDLQNRTAANLAARERVLAAQNAGAQRLNFGTPARTSRPGDMRGALQSLLAAQPANPAAFDAARSQLAAQFRDVRSADQRATQTTWAELAALEADRAKLYSEIVSQIMHDADRVKQQHPGADVTATVRADFEALSR